MKKAISIIGFNLADNKFGHSKSCKGPAEAWKTLCNIHEMKSLSNILYVRHKFFTCKMKEEDDLLDHVSKVKVLVDQLAYLEAPIRKEDIVMALLESLSELYEHLINVDVIMSLGDDVDEEFDDGVCDGKFDAQNAKVQGERTPNQTCIDNIVSKQNGQSTFVTRRKDVLLLLQTGFYWAILL